MPEGPAALDALEKVVLLMTGLSTLALVAGGGRHERLARRLAVAGFAAAVLAALAYAALYPW